MSISLSLSSWTSSQFSWSRFFQSSAWREMVWLLVSGSHGERGLGVGEESQQVLCLLGFNSLLSWWCHPSLLYSIQSPSVLPSPENKPPVWG